MVRLPEGMRISLSVYLTSDAAGINAVVSVGGGKAIKEDIPASLVDVAISTAGETAGISDFRPMTDEEIAVYIKAQEEDEDNE